MITSLMFDITALIHDINLIRNVLCYRLGATIEITQTVCA